MVNPRIVLVIIKLLRTTKIYNKFIKGTIKKKKGAKSMIKAERGNLKSTLVSKTK